MLYKEVPLEDLQVEAELGQPSRLQRRKSRRSLFLTAGFVLFTFLCLATIRGGSDYDDEGTGRSRSTSTGSDTTAPTANGLLGWKATLIPPRSTLVSRPPRSRMLLSLDNSWGGVGELYMGNHTAFNPSILPLPLNIAKASGYDYVVVARAEKQQDVDAKGERYYPRHLLGCMMKRDPYGSADHRNPSIMNCSTEVATLDLVPVPADYQSHCLDIYYEAVWGGEDGRLFWHQETGAPVMIYNSNAYRKDMCRNQFMVDLREVYPLLAEIMDKSAVDTPRYPIQGQHGAHVDLVGKEKMDWVQKNWAAMPDGRHFHASLNPQTIYRYDVETGSLVLHKSSTAQDENCLADQLKLEDTPLRIDHHLHHATGFLRVALCHRGDKCDLEKDTILLALIHVKWPQRYYERRVITLDPVTFEYLSVSNNPINYGGTLQSDLIFTTSIAFEGQAAASGVGYLNDRVVISMGIWDEKSAYVVTTVEELMRQHRACK